MSLPFIPADKANHLSYGAAISAAVITLTAFLPVLGNVHNFKMILAGALGVAVATALGITKEIMDKKANVAALQAGLPAPHGVEVADTVYTVIGGVLPAIPIVVVHLINHFYP